MTESTRKPRASRESRLLLATVAVCALALVVLARIRFPDQMPATDVAAPAPLERLAARASYDALAGDIQRVEPMIGTRLVVLRVAADLPASPRTVRDALDASSTPSPLRHVAALRVDTETAVAVLPPGARVEGIVGERSDTTASVLGVDPLRHIARVKVPSAPFRALRQMALASLSTPAYVVAVEATQAGITQRPVFLGRGDRFRSHRWPSPLLPLGGIAVTPGALMFTLDGTFIGVVVSDSGSPAIVGAGDLLDIDERLANGAPAPVDYGLALQRLTPELGAALGTGHGVVVADVAPGSALAALLSPGDVIVNINGWTSDDPDELLLRLGTERDATLAVVRDRQPRSISLGTLDTPRDRGAARSAAAAVFRGERGVGTRVVEQSGSALLPGLEPGDLITRAGAMAAPTPVQVQQVLDRSQGSAVFVVRRGGRQRVVAVPVKERTVDLR